MRKLSTIESLRVRGNPTQHLLPSFLFSQSQLLYQESNVRFAKAAFKKVPDKMFIVDIWQILMAVEISRPKVGGMQGREGVALDFARGEWSANGVSAVDQDFEIKEMEI